MKYQHLQWQSYNLYGRLIEFKMCVVRKGREKTGGSHEIKKIPDNYVKNN